jgi:hypothetical protein
MATTPNGYVVISNRDDCQLFTIKPGLVLPLRPGDAGHVLAKFLIRYDRNIEPLRTDTTFGWAYRPNTNSPDTWSEHAAGTAVDTNSTDHPNGAENTFSAAQEAQIKRELDALDGVLKWGGFFRYTKDEMHWELIGTLYEINLVARRLAKENTVALHRLQPGKRNIDVYMVKRKLRRRGFNVGTYNLYYGVALTNGVKVFQADTKLPVTGILDRETLKKLNFRVVD